jgi:hypothetical protein
MNSYCCKLDDGCYMSCNIEQGCRAAMVMVTEHLWSCRECLPAPLRRQRTYNAATAPAAPLRPSEGQTAALIRDLQDNVGVTHGVYPYDTHEVVMHAHDMHINSMVASSLLFKSSPTARRNIYMQVVILLSCSGGDGQKPNVC